MAAPILVTGGTGTLGRLVVSRLTDAGREVRVLSRRSHDFDPGKAEFVTGDLAAGTGVAAAVRGVGTIVHCASANKGDAQATANLVGAASASDPAPHLVYISIVGVDRLPVGYMRSKLESEQVVAGSGLPWTTLRATQFYDLILSGARQLTRLPVIPVPAGFVVQPVDAGEVAGRLAELAMSQPAGRVPDMAGPRERSFADLITAYLRATGRRRPVMPILMPATRKIRAGALIPVQPDGTGPLPVLGTRTWEEFLASR